MCRPAASCRRNEIPSRSNTHASCRVKRSARPRPCWRVHTILRSATSWTAKMTSAAGIFDVRRHVARASAIRRTDGPRGSGPGGNAQERRRQLSGSTPPGCCRRRGKWAGIFAEANGGGNQEAGPGNTRKETVETERSVGSIRNILLAFARSLAAPLPKR